MRLILFYSFALVAFCCLRGALSVIGKKEETSPKLSSTLPAHPKRQSVKSTHQGEGESGADDTEPKTKKSPRTGSVRKRTSSSPQGETPSPETSRPSRGESKSRTDRSRMGSKSRTETKRPRVKSPTPTEAKSSSASMSSLLKDTKQQAGDKKKTGELPAVKASSPPSTPKSALRRSSVARASADRLREVVTDARKEAMQELSDQMSNFVDPNVDACDNFEAAACGKFTGELISEQKVEDVFTAITLDIDKVIRGALDEGEELIPIPDSSSDPKKKKRAETPHVSTAMKKALRFYDACEEKQAGMPTLLKHIEDVLGYWPLVHNFDFEAKHTHLFDNRDQFLPGRIRIAKLLADVSIANTKHSPLINVTVARGYSQPDKYEIVIDRSTPLMTNLGDEKVRKNYATFADDLVGNFIADAKLVRGLDPGEESEEDAESVGEENAESVGEEATVEAAQKFNPPLQNRRNTMIKQIIQIDTRIEELGKMKEDEAIILPCKKLERLVNGFTWEEYLKALLPEELYVKYDSGELTCVVNDPLYFEGVKEILKTVQLIPAVNYLVFRFAASVAYAASEEIADLYDDYNLKHNTECVNDVKEHLKYVADAIYLNRKNKNWQAKNEQLKTVMKHIREVAIEQLQLTNSKTSWIDGKTMGHMLAKLKDLKTVFDGSEFLYDAKQIDDLYKNLKFTEKDDYMTMLLKTLTWKRRAPFARLEPYNRYDFPHSVLDYIGGHYNAFKNNLIVGAPALQPPFYNPLYPMARVFATVGFTLGHEASHLFDTNSFWIQTNGLVSPKKEMTANTTQMRDHRERNIIENYGKQQMDYSEELVDGKRTLNENIADNDGIVLAYLAYKKWEKKEEKKKEKVNIPKMNYSNDAIFFFGIAENMCLKVPQKSIEEARRLFAVAKHSPPKVRINLIVQRLWPQFSKTFGCTDKAKMKPHGELNKMWFDI